MKETCENIDSKNRLAGSTLIEVTTALVIISTLFGLFIMIFLNVNTGASYSQRLKARGYLDQVYEESIQSKDWQSKFWSEDQWEVTKTVSRYRQLQNVYYFQLSITNAVGDTIAVTKRIYYEPNS